MDEISNLNNKFTQMLEAKADNKMVAEVTESIKHIGATKADQEKVSGAIKEGNGACRDKSK